MIDTDLTKKILTLDIKTFHDLSSSETITFFDKLRNPTPTIYQIETTNACNMKCVACPRPTLVNRKTGHMDRGLYLNILKQSCNSNKKDWATWNTFINNKLLPNSLAFEEDSFFYNVCAKSLILHGYGEPVLDPYLLERVKLANKEGFEIYFSMNPVNIKPGLIKNLCENGLNHLKFSLDGMDNQSQKKYRGKVDTSIDTTIKKIIDVLSIIGQNRFNTKIYITKLNFSSTDEENKAFLDFWGEHNVFSYIKNQERKWLYDEDPKTKNTSHYMNNFCMFPWISTCILQDGTITPCSLDYNGDIALGNCSSQSLEEIWNDEKYKQLREMHITGKFPKNHFCTNQCETPIFYEKAKQK